MSADPTLAEQEQGQEQPEAGAAEAAAILAQGQFMMKKFAAEGVEPDLDAMSFDERLAYLAAEEKAKNLQPVVEEDSSAQTAKNIENAIPDLDVFSGEFWEDIQMDLATMVWPTPKEVGIQFVGGAVAFVIVASLTLALDQIVETSIISLYKGKDFFEVWDEVYDHTYVHPPAGMF